MPGDNCKIEVDFGRQSFRVIRNSLPSERDTSQAPPSPATPCMARLQIESDKGAATITSAASTPRSRSPIGIEKFKVVTDSKRGDNDDFERDMAAGGILTSIHVPLSQPENNFEQTQKQMTDDDDAYFNRKRCFCHRRRGIEVDMNKIMFDLVSAVCNNSDDSSSGLPDRKASSAEEATAQSGQNDLSIDSKFWIGSEYRYNVSQDELLLKFVPIGKLPVSQDKLYLDVSVPKGKKEGSTRVKLSRSVKDNEIGQAIVFPMISFVRSLEAEVNVKLFMKSGILERPKLLDEWQFALNDCHCTYKRSFWRNVKCGQQKF